MKPSGPGLLFVGRFRITVLIFVPVMVLLRFSISSWFGFGKLYFSKRLLSGTICQKMDNLEEMDKFIEKYNFPKLL